MTPSVERLSVVTFLSVMVAHFLRWSSFVLPVFCFVVVCSISWPSVALSSLFTRLFPSLCVLLAVTWGCLACLLGSFILIVSLMGYPFFSLLTIPE